MVLGSFIFFLAMFFLIGMSSSLKNRHNSEDYYLASRDVSPILVGLSAMSTNNSGYMFIGFMGFAYQTGFSVVWLIFGWIWGDFLTSLFVHRHLRRISQQKGRLTFASALASWQGEILPYMRLAIALISLIFLSIYAAAQINAGGKALEALFGLSSLWGALLVAVMIAFYCVAGGIRASLWTDLAQTFTMMGAMMVLAIAALIAQGGVGASYEALSAYDGFLHWFPYSELPFGLSQYWIAGALMFIFGWLISGFCAAGQPHIMVRFMTMRSEKDLVAVRFWYYGFYALFGILAIIVGLLTKLQNFDVLADPEMVLPKMASQLLPDILVGLMLAGLFAAIMSTADSLILSCSSALTHDIFPKRFETIKEMKMATLGVTLFALLVASYAIVVGGANVFRITQFAWAGMGAGFGPLLLLLALGQKISEKQALTMMAVGLAVVIGWNLAGLPRNLFTDGVMGVGASFLVWALWKWSAPLFSPTKGGSPASV